MHINDITIIDDSKLKKAITAAALGNAMEWFDFGVYGFVAYALGQVFFPGASPGVQMIAALATFSVPFLVRPLGGLFFGAMGDKFGRQKVLSVTIIIMAVSTFCIGLIPSYASIGIWAPILLLLAKLAQGFSVGGEYSGAAIFVAEYSPDRKRGFMGSWLDFGSIAGFVMGAGVVVLISSIVGEANFLDWGWRIPFFIAAPLGLIGLYLRHALEETPAFQQHVDKMEKEDRNAIENPPKTSFKEIAAKHWKSLLVCVGIVISTNVTYYMLLTYMPSYLSHNLHYSEDHGVLIIIAIMIGMLFVQPVIGLTSDRIGRKPFIIGGSIGLLALAIPCFILINSNVIGLIFVGLLVLAVLLNSFTGVMASILPAMFPTHIRYSALAISFNISVLIAGATPTVAAWLVEATGNLYMPAYYLMVVAVIGLITGLYMKETANKPLRGATPAASDRSEAKELLQETYDNIEQKVEDINAQIAELEKKNSIRTLVPADADALAQQSFVDSVSPEVDASDSIRFRSKSATASITGVGRDYFRVNGVELLQGVTFRDDRNALQEVIIDDNARQALFGDFGVEPLGQIVFLGSVPARVIGVAKSNRNYAPNRITVWMPYSTVMYRMVGKPTLSGITVRLKDNVASESAVTAITQLLTQRHGVKDFRLYNFDKIRKSIERTSMTFSLLILMVASIALVIGSLGVMNIMLVSVTERTHEIGVRMAVGARRSDIMQQFMIEAVLVCLIGGALGIALSFAAGSLFTSLAGGMFTAIYSWQAAATAFFCSTLIGMIFGYLPARKAARMDPVVSLASE